MTLFTEGVAIGWLSAACLVGGYLITASTLMWVATELAQRGAEEPA